VVEPDPPRRCGRVPSGAGPGWRRPSCGRCSRRRSSMTGAGFYEALLAKVRGWRLRSAMSVRVATVGGDVRSFPDLGSRSSSCRARRCGGSEAFRRLERIDNEKLRKEIKRAHRVGVPRGRRDHHAGRSPNAPSAWARSPRPDRAQAALQDALGAVSGRAVGAYGSHASRRTATTVTQTRWSAFLQGGESRWTSTVRRRTPGPGPLQRPSRSRRLRAGRRAPTQSGAGTVVTPTQRAPRQSSGPASSRAPVVVAPNGAANGAANAGPDRDRVRQPAARVAVGAISDSGSVRAPGRAEAGPSRQPAESKRKLMRESW